MKLKFIQSKGYGLLVTEPVFVPNAGEYMCNSSGTVIDLVTSDNINKIYPTDYKILFAEPELGLDIPAFNWRTFVRKTEESFSRKEIFIIIEKYLNWIFANKSSTRTGTEVINEIIDSVQKYPSYVVVKDFYQPCTNCEWNYDSCPNMEDCLNRVEFLINKDSHGKEFVEIEEVIW